MPPRDDQRETPAPRSAIRRFDVFAEYLPQERLAKTYPKVEGFGIWLAKIVGACRFDKSGDAAGSSDPTTVKPTGAKHAEPKFRSVGDEFQTVQTLHHDAMERMAGDESFEK